MKTTEFIDAMLTSGYKEYPVSKVFSPNASRMFQKRVKDDNGVKYSITANYYYSCDISDKIPFSGSFEISLKFNKKFKGREFTLNVIVFSFHNVGDNNYLDICPLDILEDYIEELFQRNDFEYYQEHANSSS